MTIAAGFLHQGGVLLCSDTQQEAGALKTHGPKIGHFDCPDGKVAIAFAGNAAFAISAIQKCRIGLAKAKPGTTLDVLERTLDREYRRVVLNHPDHLSDWTLNYWLIVAFWERAAQRVSLFATEQTTLRSVADFECIGIGKDLGHYLVQPTFTTAMDEDHVLPLAAYMLAVVKEHVPGCGGISQFLAIRSDGTIKPITSVEIALVEHQAEAYVALTETLFLSMADSKSTDAEFEGDLTTFVAQIRGVRKFWQRAREQQALTEAAQRFRQAKGGSQGPGFPTDDPRSPQPSPESPGESDES